MTVHLGNFIMLGIWLILPCIRWWEEAMPMSTKRYDSAERGWMTELPILFVRSPNALRSQEAAAEELVRSILQQEFQQEIHT